MYRLIYDSKIGPMEIVAEENEITKIKFICKSNMEKTGNENFTEKEENIAVECKNELEEYFQGKRKSFNIKYKLSGTDFECRVWKELAKIPYGKTVSYKDISIGIGNEKAVRAVAGAIGKNKLGIIIPCHRVIGSNKKLTGFSAETDEKTGLELKIDLLNFLE